MIDPGTILATLALSVSFAALLVSGRFIWCLVDALQARRYLIAAASVAGVVCIVVLFSAVVIVWFGYGVAHTGKDARTDLLVLLGTVPPFFLASIGLWLVGGKLYRSLRTTIAQKETADAMPKRRD